MNVLLTELINQVIEGDSQAFEDIYHETSGYVYAVAYRMMGRAEEAEEVTQDVYLKAYKNIRKFKQKAHIKTWLYRITINTAYSKLRKTSREQQKMRDYQTEQYFEQETFKNEKYHDQEEKVKKMLQCLNPDQRACVILREMEGFSYQEIAEILKTKINTVRTRLKRARETLILKYKRQVHELQ